MSVKEDLILRSGGCCELCGSVEGLAVYNIDGESTEEKSVLLCEKCLSVIDEPTNDEKHWSCLNDSMWSGVGAVQVLVYRTLSRLGNNELLDMMYLEDEILAWAKSGLVEESSSNEPTRDANGTILNEGDTVTIIKDLVVKGAGFTAKQGTTVKNIHLTSNPEQIDARVNGVKIVLLSKFLKKI
ncbi:MAG: hypothetical protein KN64_02240 [Sulfurovum sp. AS07-7]|nr:MAG: hypothetical protein KN64_02240 [Sulfurovum sp. AS07-7]